MVKFKYKNILGISNVETNQIIEAVKDGLRVGKNFLVDKNVLPGACASFLAISRKLNQQIFESNSIGIKLMSEAILSVPKNLAKNAGHDFTTMINAKEKGCDVKYLGIDLTNGVLYDPVSNAKFDSYSVIKHLVSSSCNISTNLCLIDEIMKAGRNISKQ